MYQPSSYALLVSLLRHRPNGIAALRGDERHPTLRGEVLFYETRYGVFVVADVTGLPTSQDAREDGFFGFHIHAGEECGGADSFSMAKGHYNPDIVPHPHHAGDLPPLISVQGRAFSAFLTGRFSVREVIGKTVIIHQDPDDFTAQPAGNAGERIACGIIRG